MMDERWERIKQAFWVAVRGEGDLGETEFVAGNCVLDAAERDELQTLLDEHDKLARAAAEKSIEPPAPPLLHDRFEVLDRLSTGA